MRTPIQLLGIYLHLARDAARRQQLLYRDKMLVMGGMLAAQLKLTNVASYCRARILEHNPGHMLRRWRTFDVALNDPDFQHFVRQIQRRFPLEKAEGLLDELGIELGDNERGAYYTDEEYAAAVLGTTVAVMRTESDHAKAKAGRTTRRQRRPMTREQSREVDRFAIHELGMPGVVLMENAGRGVAQFMLAHSVSAALVVCGSGNNGGDGYVVARHLELAGVAVRVVAAAPATRGDAKVNSDIWTAGGGVVHPWSDELRLLDHRFKEIDDSRLWIVDGLLGTGAKGPPREPFASLIVEMNRLRGRKLALDLPSGMDCDTGRAELAFRANDTCTFVAPKVGFEAADANVLGNVHVVSIGVPMVAIEHALNTK